MKDSAITLAKGTSSVSRKKARSTFSTKPWRRDCIRKLSLLHAFVEKVPRRGG